MILIDLVNQVFRRVDQPRLIAYSDLTQDDDVLRVVDSFNITLRRIFQNVPDKALPRIITALYTVEGQQTYALGDGIDPKKVTRIQHSVSKLPLTRRDAEYVLFEQDLAQRGSPTAFYEYENRLGLWPTPDATYGLAVSAAKSFVPLAAAEDGNDLPDTWQNVLILYGIAVEKAELGMPDAQPAYSEYLLEYNKLVARSSIASYGVEETPPNGLDNHA